MKKTVGFFGALFPHFSPKMFMNGFIKAAYIFLGARIDFVWNTNCFLEHELNTNCSEINETMNGHSWRNSSCWERTLFAPLLKH